METNGFSLEETDMRAISFGGKTLGVLALAGVIGTAASLLGCGRSDASAQGASPDPIPAKASVATTPEATAPVGTAQTICPIMGGKINKAIFADYQGKRVYFCCGGCPAVFKKDPAKYVKAMEDKGIVLDKTPQ
jgi:YHS domain-containing protein